MREDEVRVAIIGSGRIGRLHAANLAFRIPKARLLAVTDINASLAERSAEEYNIPTVATDHHAILADPEIDAVIICSSTDTHSQMIEEAAEAGKHIFCEKPIDFNINRLDRALSKVETAGVKFQVGFQRRFDTSFLRLRQLVLEGSLGELIILRITSRSPEPPSIEYIRGSGGLFLDMMIHDFDMARFLTGSEVEEVYAAGGARVDPEIGRAGDIDTSIVMLRFENGTMGTIDCCRKTAYGYDQRIEVFGTGGLARVENERANRVSIAKDRVVQEELPLYSFVERYREAYVKEMEGFIRCVLEDGVPEVTGVDGRMPVLIGHAARKSLEENRPVRVGEL